MCHPGRVPENLWWLVSPRSRELLSTVLGPRPWPRPTGTSDERYARVLCGVLDHLCEDMVNGPDGELDAMRKRRAEVSAIDEELRGSWTPGPSALLDLEEAMFQAEEILDGPAPEEFDYDGTARALDEALGALAHHWLSGPRDRDAALTWISELEGIVETVWDAYWPVRD